MIFRRLSLTTQLLTLMMGTTLLTIIILVYVAILQIRTVLQQEIDERVAATARAAADLTATPLAARDIAGVEQILAAVVREKALNSAFVYDSLGAVVAEQFDEARTINVKPFEGTRFAVDVMRAGTLLTRHQTSHVEIAVPIIANGKIIGVLAGQSSFSEAANQVSAAIPRMLATGLVVALVTGMLALLSANYITTPLHKLAEAASAIGRGDLTTIPEVRRGGELGALASAFAQMVAHLRTAQAEVARNQDTLEARVAGRTTQLEQALLKLRESVSTREQLSATLREQASPVIPVLQGLLVMPLIGSIDPDRAKSMLKALLEGIEQHHARLVIIDVTGVPVMDEHAAHALLKAASVVKLLGAEAILVGLSPELVQTLVALGLDLSGLVTRSDLQSGISYAMQRQAQRSDS